MSDLDLFTPNCFIEYITHADDIKSGKQAQGRKIYAQLEGAFPDIEEAYKNGEITEQEFLNYKNDMVRWEKYGR